MENNSEDYSDILKYTLILKYKISDKHVSSNTVSLESQSANEMEVVDINKKQQYRLESKTSDQINDFVRKLGFLVKDRKGGDYVKVFLRMSEVSIKYFYLSNKQVSKCVT